MKQLKKTLLTLVALLAVTTGAWAGEEPQLLTTINASSSFLTGSQTFDDIATVTFGGAGTIAFNNGWIQDEYDKEATVTVKAVDGYTITSIKLYAADSNNATISTSPFTAYLNKFGATYVTTGSDGAGNYVGDELARIEVYGYQSAPSGTPVDIVWDAAAKTATIAAMPAGNVTVSVEYYPQAAFATTGTEPDVKTLLPEAAEGVIAGTDASLIAEGTGIVAFAGTSTEVTQGTLMYAIGTSATEAPALTAFSATVPTAENVADDGGNVYVWYYIQGADTPDGQEATEENTFNDTEICTTPLTVPVLSNKFDLTLKAANVNTIDATPSSKGSVSVAGTDKTGEITDEGKLTAIKMGSEVKLNAKQGYKFRKVEVKKSEKLQSITIGSVTLVYVEGDKWSKIVERNSEKLYIANDWIWSDYGVLMGSDYVDPNSPIDTSLQYRWDG